MPMADVLTAAVSTLSADFGNEETPILGALGTVYRWLATDGVAIAIWVVGAAILIRFIRWGAYRYGERLERDFTESDLLIRSERAKHLRAVMQVVTWTLIVMVALFCGIKILGILNIPITGLVGPGAVIGAALGFGAQRVVQDLLAGFFVVTEKQYGYGDLVSLMVTGGRDADGTVEDVTLRVTKIRTSDGEVVTVPNGQIITATNLSKDWARAVVDVPIPADADVSRVTELLEQVGKDFFDDPRMHSLLLDAPAPLGVTDLELDSLTIRMVARTLPGKQFEISRALRVRIVRRLAAAGITVVPTTVASQAAPPTSVVGGGERTDV